MQGFGISDEDVANVLGRVRSRLTDPHESVADLATRIYDEVLDHARVEKAALNGGVDLDEQTSAAYDDIEQQLVQAGILRV